MSRVTLLLPSIACRSIFATRCLASSSKAGGEASGSKCKSKTSKAASSGTSAAAEAKTTAGASTESIKEQLPLNQPAGNEYKVPEYYQHNINSYADFFVQMSQQRLPRAVRPGRN